MLCWSFNILNASNAWITEHIKMMSLNICVMPSVVGLVQMNKYTKSKSWILDF